MEDSDARKRKLEQIRAKAKAAENRASDAVENEESAKKVKFRNYQPRDEKLNVLVAPIGEAATVVTIDQKDLGPLDIIKQEIQQGASKDINIIPKKANWDLKNQVESKLQKLKKRTQRAIVDILKEKLLAESNHDNSDSDNDID